MAATKKKATNKPQARKKVVAKKTTTKRPVAKKSTSHAAHAHVSAQKAFMKPRFSEQTLYWLIIGLAVLALAAWVLSLQIKTNNMYDDINTTSDGTVIKTKKTTPQQR